MNGLLFPKYLNFGSKGWAVVVLQVVLRVLGYNSSIVVNGQYDDETAAGVMALQEEANIGVDGNFGPTTRAAFLRLYDVNVDKLPGFDPATYIIVLLQVVLKALGYNPSIVPDGEAARETRKGMREFQAQLGVPKSGKFTKVTRAAIMAAYSVDFNSLPTFDGVTTAVGPDDEADTLEQALPVDMAAAASTVEESVVVTEVVLDLDTGEIDETTASPDETPAGDAPTGC